MSAVNPHRKPETEDEKTAREYRESQGKKGAPFGDTSSIKSKFAEVRERLSRALPKRPTEAERKAAREKRIEKLKEKKEEIELNSAIDKARYQQQNYQQKIQKQRTSSVDIGFGSGTLEPLAWYGLSGQNKSAAGMAFNIDAYNKIFNNYGSGGFGSGQKKSSAWDGNILNMGGPSFGMNPPDMRKLKKFYGMG